MKKESVCLVCGTEMTNWPVCGTCGFRHQILSSDKGAFADAYMTDVSQARVRWEEQHCPTFELDRVRGICRACKTEFVIALAIPVREEGDAFYEGQDQVCVWCGSKEVTFYAETGEWLAPFEESIADALSTELCLDDLAHCACCERQLILRGTSKKVTLTVRQEFDDGAVIMKERRDVAFCRTCLSTFPDSHLIECCVRQIQAEGVRQECFGHCIQFSYDRIAQAWRNREVS